jgi:hypothetical protein
VLLEGAVCTSTASLRAALPPGRPPPDANGATGPVEVLVGDRIERVRED